MHYLLARTTLLAFLGSAFASKIHIVNNCKSNIYYRQSSGGGYEPDNVPLGSGFSQDAGQSVSIKFSKSPNKNGGKEPIVQFEFHADEKDIYYDTSNIDGNPFQAEGTHLQPSVGPSTDHPSCVTVDCPAGGAVCTQAYNQPDDVRTKVCAASTDLTFTLCSSNSGSSSSGNANTGDSGSSNGNTNGGNSLSSTGSGNDSGGGFNANKSTTKNNALSPTTAAAAASSTSIRKWGHPYKRSGHA